MFFFLFTFICKKWAHFVPWLKAKWRQIAKNHFKQRVRLRKTGRILSAKFTDDRIHVTRNERSVTASSNNYSAISGWWIAMNIPGYVSFLIFDRSAISRNKKEKKETHWCTSSKLSETILFWLHTLPEYLGEKYQFECLQIMRSMSVSRRTCYF